jgi:hypothetical protein
VTHIFNHNAAALALVVTMTGCIHLQSKRPELSNVLKLDATFDAIYLQSVVTVRGLFLLRNIAAAAIELCEVDSGVNVVAITARGPFPLVGHGTTFDAQPVCYELRPGETKEFTEEFAWSRTTDLEKLQGSIRVSAWHGGDPVVITSSPVSVRQPLPR